MLLKPRQFFLLLPIFLGAALLSCDSSGSSISEEPTGDKPGNGNPSGNEASLDVSVETGRKTIHLSWEKDGIEDLDRYRLYRSTGADFDTTGSFYVKTTESEYKDKEVGPSRTYYYRTAAFDDHDSLLVLSDAAKGLAPPGAPEDVDGEGQFYEATLGWSEAQGKIQGYNIYRSKSSFSTPGEAAKKVAANHDSTSFADNTALDGQTYVYRLAALDQSGNEGSLSPEVEVTPSYSGNPSRGKELFKAACSRCHISGDAWDLQAFSMPDTMIHQRALKHVTEEEALDIIQYAKSGEVKPFDEARFGKRALPPFQPGGKILDSDKHFAQSLFGADRWPEDLSVSELRDMKLTDIPIPFPLPHWNVKGDETDWLPTQAMPGRISEKGGFKVALDKYQNAPTDQNFFNLYDAVHELEREHRDRYPHQYDPSQEEMAEVYDLNRWLSSLVALHVMRTRGDRIEDFRSFLRENRGQGERWWSTLGKHRSLVTEMWAVGDLMRVNGPDLSSVNLPPEYGREENYIKRATVRWFYLSWLLRPGVESSFDILYFPRLLETSGYARVSAFFSAYVIANAKHGSKEVYDVLIDYPYQVPEEWVPNLMHFVMDAYISRIEGGEELEGETVHQREHLKRGVERTIEHNDHLTAEDKEHLREDMNRVLDWLKEQGTDK